MKVIYNRFFPFGKFLAINIFGVLFVNTRDMSAATGLSTRTYNHEEIHTAQMKELGYVFFYLIYFLEWLFRVLAGCTDAYRGLSFEKEAYDNEGNLDYLGTRKHFAQWRK